MALDFPFWASLPKEAQTALMIAEHIRDTGATISEASKAVTGYSYWNATSLRGGLNLAQSSIAELGVSSAEATELISVGMEAAGSSAAGGMVSAGLARVAAALGMSEGAALGVILVGVAIVAYVGGNALGWFASDGPIAEILSGDRATEVPAPAYGGGGSYYVWNLSDISDGTIYIGTEGNVTSYKRCDFPGGGLCEGAGLNPPNAYALAGPFNDYTAAYDDLCNNMTEAPYIPPLTQDYYSTVYGSGHFMVEAYCSEKW